MKWKSVPNVIYEVLNRYHQIGSLNHVLFHIHYAGPRCEAINHGQRKFYESLTMTLMFDFLVNMIGMLDRFRIILSIEYSFSRAWVPINNCFILSKEYPGVEKKKSNVNFEKSLSELQMHIDHLKRLYGHFNYACPQTALSKTKPFKFVSIIDGKFHIFLCI